MRPEPLPDPGVVNRGRPVGADRNRSLAVPGTPCSFGGVRADLVDRLIAQRPHYRYERLQRAHAERLLHEVLTLLFPHFATNPHARPELIAVTERIEADLTELLGAVGIVDSDAGERIERFFEKLPRVAECLFGDAQFIADHDPAASSVDEVILAYPGFFAICAHRVAHQLSLLDVPIVPRLISEHAHERSGCDIHPEAQLGCPFFIDHGTGIVIGQTAQVGARVRLYQGVTIGARSVHKAHARVRRHPTIGDDVVIYANATVLGAETYIGAGSIIGGNVWLTQSVAPRSVVVHTAEVHVQPAAEDGSREGFGF